jgi:hypothetical protein
MPIQSRLQSRAFLDFGLQTRVGPPLESSNDSGVHPLQRKVGRGSMYRNNVAPSPRPKYLHPLESSKVGTGTPPTEWGRGSIYRNNLAEVQNPEISAPLNRQKEAWVNPPQNWAPDALS